MFFAAIITKAGLTRFKYHVKNRVQYVTQDFKKELKKHGFIQSPESLKIPKIYFIKILSKNTANRCKHL